MNFTNAPDTPRAQEATPREREECARLKRYIKALKQAHQKEIDGLLAQARQQARQIAELRIEAGQGAATAARREPAANAAGQGTAKAVTKATGQAAAKAAGRAVLQVSTLKVEDILPVPSRPPVPQAPPPCSPRRAG